MILPFNADRPVTCVAAASRGDELPQLPLGSVGSPAPFGWPSSSPPASTGHRDGALRRVRREHFEAAIEAAVVGEPDQLQGVLTVDAVGWSPALRYGSREEAVAALREHPAALSVTEFHIVRLIRPPPFLVAEWHLAAVHDQAFLVADDLLIDVSQNPLHLSGTTVAKVRGTLIEAVHTYYDEASLVEQVVLGVEIRH